MPTTTLEMQGAIKLREVFQVYLPRMREGRLGFELMPVSSVDEVDLVYERRGEYRGLQSPRGLGGSSATVAKPNVNSWRVSPGYYGDAYVIEEDELTNLRQIADWSNWDSYDKQSARAVEHLTQRMLDRQEYSIFQLMQTGGFTSKNKQGLVLHQDVFDVYQSTPGTLFSDVAASTPLKHFRDLIVTLQAGRSVNFSAGKGTIYCNRASVNQILANTNSADLGGKRFAYGETLNSKEELDEIMLSNDLPSITVYDEGYYSDAGVFSKYIPDGKYLLTGKRKDGERLGEYRTTRHAIGSGGNGEWQIVRDKRDRTPPKVIIEAGHNGGPVAYYTEGFACINGY
jgi:hypothetical protein